MTEREYLTAWWRYGLAIWCWDRGDPKYLGRVVGAGYVCPPQLAPVLGNIIDGTRKVNRKAAAKFRIDGVAAALVACKLAATLDAERRVQEQAEDLADAQRLEPAQVIAASFARVRDMKAALAAEAVITVETLEKTELALRRFVEQLTSD